jgi:uncharacterized membrane protein YdjX (TVP38/TMEM64 family)
MSKTNWIKFGGLIVLIIILISISRLFDWSQLADRQYLQRIVEQNYLVAVLVYLGIFWLIKFTFLPINPVIIMGGAVFGGILGGAYALVAIYSGSIALFFLGRKLGKQVVTQIIEAKFVKIQKANQNLKNQGFRAVFILRILPLAPLAVMNLFLAVSKVRFRDYLWGTLIGAIPGTMLLANAGGYLFDFDSWQFYVYAGAYLAMIFFTSYWIYFRKRET